MSVTQILEAEKKLRVSSLFSLRSSKYGIIDIRHILSDDSDEFMLSKAVEKCASYFDNFSGVIGESLDHHYECDERSLVSIWQDILYLKLRCGCHVLNALHPFRQIKR